MKKKTTAVFLMVGLWICTFGCTLKEDTMNTSKAFQSVPSVTSSVIKETTQSNAEKETKESPSYLSSSEYRYCLIGDDVKLDCYLGNQMNVTIPSEIDGRRVKIIGMNTFYQKKRG